MTTDKLVAEVRRLDAAATNGPWRSIKNVHYVSGPDCRVAQCGDYADKELAPFNGERWQADTDLIAEYRTAAPALADAVEARDRALDALSQFTRTLLIEKAKLLPQSADTMLRAHFGLELVDGKWGIRE